MSRHRRGGRRRRFLTLPAKKRTPTGGAAKARGLANGYRSGLEELVAQQLDARKIPYDYEGYPLRYTIPERDAKYTVDFVLPNGILIETKGRFVTEDRKKHKLIKEQHPDLDIRIVFSNPNNKIGKKSKTTYAAWCSHLGIQFAAKLIPDDWLDEPAIPSRVEAAKRVLGWSPPKER